MKVIITLLISLLLPFSFLSQAADINEDLPRYSQVYDYKSDPFSDANAALALAKATNRQVLIEIGGNWCTWCHKMDAFLAKNQDVYQALHSQYVVLKVSVSDANKNEEFMSSLPRVQGYPHMYLSTSGGELILSKDTAELVSGNKYSRDNWLTFLDKWSVASTTKSVKKTQVTAKLTESVTSPLISASTSTPTSDKGE